MDSYEDEGVGEPGPGRSPERVGRPAGPERVADSAGAGRGPDAEPETGQDVEAEVEPGAERGVERDVEPDAGREAADPGPNGSAEGARAGIAALSMPYQVAAAVALAVLGVFACVHLAMVFLHVAPSNTVTKKHGEAVDDWVYPEFEQNWKLFAPNPLQQNISVEVRAEIAGKGGGRTTTDWIDLSAQDTARIRGNVLPSHTAQNELRRAWDFYLNSHTDDHRPNGLRGELSGQYMRRIVMLRLDERALGGTVEKIQLRSVSRPVPSPAWSTERTDTRPVVRDYPWWRITDADRPAGSAEAAEASGADRPAGSAETTAQARTETAR
ncbi:DUF5819 family protein [Streptomyces sp. NPDC053493]|uniref:DUF5819 family protein n=1 Tax=Streptomyces sp. NPDC053493 TaxID=3365705 RepID=UPI0037D5E44B